MRAESEHVGRARDRAKEWAVCERSEVREDEDEEEKVEDKEDCHEDEDEDEEVEEETGRRCTRGGGGGAGRD
jgi:hypothetical protein